MPTFHEVRTALTALSLHPHDHGWHAFYGLLGALMDEEAKQEEGAITRIITACERDRPHLSPSHAVTLLCIAIKSVSGDQWRAQPIFDPRATVGEQVAILRTVVTDHEETLQDRVLTKQNSFSSARRFLAPQAVISHFARRQRLTVRMADLGTGPGLLPRQLNSESCFRRFSPDFVWKDWEPTFIPTDIAVRWGVDRAPLQDLDWIHHSHGPSSYYDERYEELTWALVQPDVSDVRLEVAELDLLETDKLSEFIGENELNVITCSFVLYQYAPESRRRVISAVVNSMASDGLFVSMEPNGDLLQAGCTVRLYLSGRAEPIEFARISNGHFMGEVLAGTDFKSFLYDKL